LTPSTTTGPKNSGQNATWRKARWTDSEQDLSMLLALLPVLNTEQQAFLWQQWQVLWQALTWPLMAEAEHDLLPTGATPMTTMPQRRALDAIPFYRALLTQLAMVSREQRKQWVAAVMAGLPAHIITDFIPLPAGVSAANT
jgi:hypothetical protein